MGVSGKGAHVLSGVPYDEYVGRSMPRYGLREQGWGNPYRVGRDGTLGEVLRKYEEGLRHWLGVPSEGPVLKQEIAELRDKTLACWCAPRHGAPLTLDDPEICHGQVLLRLAEEFS